MKAGTQKLLALARVEWRLRQQSTFLGFLWTLLHPALMFAILYTLFEKWLGHATENYAAFLLIGLVQWNFFAAATSYALSSLMRRGHVIKNYPLPLAVPVLASVLSVYFSHLLELGALALLIAFFQNSPSLPWLWLFVIDAVFLALAAGIGLFLAGLYVFFSDLERIWGILLTAGFFLTPVFYPLSQLGPDRAALMNLSPLAVLIEASRSAFSGGLSPQTGLWWCAAWAAAALLCGAALLRYKRSAIKDAL